MRGLIAMTHAASTAAAYDDWCWLANIAKQRDMGELVTELWPRSNAGHRTIDKKSHRLMTAMGVPPGTLIWEMRQDPQYSPIASNDKGNYPREEETD